MGLAGANEEEAEPSTRPWPLNLPDDEEEKGLLTFFMKPLTLSFMSSMFESLWFSEDRRKSAENSPERLDLLIGVSLRIKEKRYRCG